MSEILEELRALEGHTHTVLGIKNVLQVKWASQAAPKAFETGSSCEIGDADKTQHLELWVTAHFDARALKVEEVTDESMPIHFIFLVLLASF